jgi:hypothetical protein
VAARAAAVAVREKADLETRVANQKEVWHLQVRVRAKECQGRAVKLHTEAAAKVETAAAEEEANNKSSQ